MRHHLAKFKPDNIYQSTQTPMLQRFSQKTQHPQNEIRRTPTQAIYLGFHRRNKFTHKACVSREDGSYDRQSMTRQLTSIRSALALARCRIPIAVSVCSVNRPGSQAIRWNRKDTQPASNEGSVILAHGSW